jgi:hypothetical protein
MYPMNTHAILHETLNELCSDECNFVGTASTNDVIRFVISGTQPSDIAQHISGGGDSTFLEAIQLLAAVSVIAKNTLDIYKFYKDKSKADDLKEGEELNKLKAVIELVWKKAGDK